MGWINYIIVPKLKAKFGISRYFDGDTEDVAILKKMLENLRDKISTLYMKETLDKTINDLSLSDLTKMLEIVSIVSDTGVSLEYSEELLFLSFIQKRGLEYYIVSENNEKEMEKYKDYINLNYEVE